ncbi:MAG TPA: amidase [Chitinophagaceae bacterium]|nr:amidase [Chitinophagaceae bacterium]HEX5654124.1 amidase [Chitinophagaceae bacterium]
MRIPITFALCILFLPCFSQSKSDSIHLIREALTYYDLNFSESEVDSMLDNMKENRALYTSMHQFYPPNQLPYPFAFNPLIGQKVSGKKEKISWEIPNRTLLPTNRNDLAFYSIPQLAALIVHKKISSVELTKFFLDRLKKWGDTLQCVISLTEEIAMKQARQADEELKKGIYRGPLHGIPYGLKDLFAVKGTKTTWGSEPYKDQVIEEDAFVYRQLQNAGAILCAKLSLGALAYDNKWFGGATKNPWNLNQGSSGSSAGSAAATAAGLLPFAIGTETWGSIISPSTRCGTTGLRPSFGATSRSGGMVLSWSLDKIGPICRSAEDAAIVFAFIHGTDDKDPGSLRHTFNYTGKIPDWKKLRVAYASNYFKRLDSSAAEWKVLEVYRGLGAYLQPVIFPDSAIYPFDMMNIIISAESAAAFDELTRTNRDDLIERQDKNFWPNIFRTARMIPAVEYINANRYRSKLCQELNAFMKNFDIVIVPTYAGNQLAITNLTGHPALCMPMGFNKNGSPISITLIGNLYDEATILAAAKAFQDKTIHHKKHPPKFLN